MNSRYVYQIAKTIIKRARRNKIVLIHAETSSRILLTFYMIIFMKPTWARKANTKVPKRYEQASDIFNI